MTSEALGPTPAATLRQRASEIHALEDIGVDARAPLETPLAAEKAVVGDASEIHRLIQYWFEATGDVLPRTEGEIY